MRRSGHEQGDRALQRDVVVDVSTETGVLAIAGARPRARDVRSDAALREEAAAERVVALDAGFPGIFRLRVTRHVPEAAVLVSAPLRCGARGAVVGDEGLLAGGAGGLPLPLPRGRLQIDVRAPASDDPEAADFVLTVAPLSRRAALPGAEAALALVEPARHPRPRSVQPVARVEHRARLQAALRAAGAEDDARAAALDAYLRVVPRDARVLVQRAQLRRARGDLVRALDDAWRATTVAPNDGAAWSALAALLHAAGNPREAAQARARARALGGGGGSVLTRRRAGGRLAAR